MSNDPLAAVLDWFLEIEQWLPGAHSWVGEIVYGEIPKSDATAVYDLADAWGVLAERLNEAYEEISTAGEAVMESWVGDGGAAAFREHWRAYVEALAATAEGAAQMQQGVQKFGVQVELMKFMTAINLLLLAYTLFALIVAALYSFGISLGGAVPAIMSFQTAVSSAASKVLGAIANIAMRIGLRPLTFVLGRAVPAAVRTSIAAGARAALPAVVSRTVPAVVRTGVAGLARRAATRGISRSVSSRLASQALRGAAGRRLRAELAGEVAEGAARFAAGRGAGRFGSWAAGRGAAAGARQLGARATLAVRSELAREIQRQMLVRAGARTAIRASESAAIRQMAAAQVGRLALGRELAEYVGIRVAFGAGFLGGGNLLGQLGQMAEGNRTELDMGQVTQGALTGAVFATGMWGGVVGHTAGGAVAGGLMGAAYEGVEYLFSDDPHKKEFDLQAVGHHAVQGAIMGVIAGADIQVSTMRFSGGLRIGDNVHALASTSGNLNIVAAAGDGRVIAIGDAGVAYQHPLAGADGGVQRILSEGMAHEPGVGDVFRALMPDTATGTPTPATPARVIEAPAAARAPAQPPIIDVPARDAGTGGGRPPDGGGGGGGGGPRQPVSQAPHGPASPRAPERVAAGEPAAPAPARPAPEPVPALPAPESTPPARPTPESTPARPAPEPVPERPAPPPPVEVSRDGSATPATVDTAAPAEGAVVPARDGAGPEVLSQELAAAPPETFEHGRNRTGAELPQQVHELVDKARTHLLDRYPEHVVADRIHDLDQVAAVADRVDALAAQAQRTGDVRDLVQGVRDLSQAVNEYSDKYAGWRDYSRGGEPADAGWRDLHGVDPLESVEMATRVVSIDPSTNRFHVMDQAIAIAKIGDVLGPVFEQHAHRTFERVVPKNMDSVRALLPDDLASSLEPWVNDPGAKGGYRSDVGVTFVAAEYGGQPRPISAVAATVVHEGLHALQPHSRMVFEAVQDGLNRGRLSPTEADSILANLRFEREYDAFAVQQAFLRGLTGSNSPGFHSDPRIPNSDGYRGLADWSPEQVRDHVFQQYLTANDRQLVGADVLRRHPDLTPQSAVARAETAIASASHPIPYERQQGTFYGPVTSRMADQYGLDLVDIQRRQAEQPPPDLAQRSDVDGRDGIEAERGVESDSGQPMSLAGFTEGVPPGGPDHTPQAPSTRPTTPLHIVAFDAGPGRGGLMERVSTALGGVGDHVLLRQPDVPSTDLTPGVRVSGAEPIPGITGHISPLLRLDGLPADANVIVGYRETAGIADVRRDAFPHAKVVQILDAVPTEPAHIEVIARADLVVAVGPEVARGVAGLLDGLGLERTPPVRELPPLDSQGGARGLHDAIAGLGEGVARVDPATWQRELSPREVVLRRAGEVEAPTGDRLRVMTVTTEYWSSRGGILTANRELAEAFGAAGAEVYARVSSVDPARPELTRAEPQPGVHVIGTKSVWGVLDAKGLPDTRALSMLPENLPPHVDIVVGHSRFGGGAARWLVEHVYPDAKYVHVLHTSPEVLDALAGTPAEGLQHAQTERSLMRDADLVAGVGPLLGQEAARLSGEASPVPPPVHQIISDMPAVPVDPPARPPDRTGFEIVFQGRADAPIKSVDFAAKLISDLRANGVDARLTIRGMPSIKEATELAGRLSEIAGAEIVVKAFSTSKAELLADLHNADLVIMPSVHEGFGLAASEAARAGVPVIVGEGTGAGLFFGDPQHVPARLGEAAVVRDGVTVQMLREVLAAATAPDGTLTAEAVGSVLEQVDQHRLQAWTVHVKELLDALEAHRQRALELRDYLDQRFPPGNAARRLLEAMQGGDPGGSPVEPPPVEPSSGPAAGSAGHEAAASPDLVDFELLRSALMPESRPPETPREGRG